MVKRTFAVILLCVLAVAGCTGIQRGVVGSTYISNAKPVFAVTVPSLPLSASGSATPAVTTEDSLGGIPVDAWIAVYGGTAVGQPMAIVAQAEIPPAWYWDANLYRAFSVQQGAAILDGVLYQACTYIVDGSNDAFSSLVPGVDPNSLRWIVRRVATRTDFNLGKITLEYREPLPQGYEILTNLPQGGQTFLDAFARRAEKAFVFSVPDVTSSRIQKSYISGLRIRFLNTNFWGTMSRYDIND